MLRSLKDLQGYKLGASDGEIGSVETFYFDDQHWTIRYVVVDTGGWLPGRQVLISPMAITGADWVSRRLFVSLTNEQVENSPSIERDKPVSRQFEVDYYNYYGWPYYWAGAGVWGGWAYPAALVAAPAARPGGAVATDDVEQRGDPHLRSAKEVVGYHIQGTDDTIGHVEDFVLDDESWRIRYLVVDTSNWWFGKKVLVAPDWVDRVDWMERKVFVELTTEQIKNGPESDPNAPINGAYEERLYDAYGRPAYWR